MSENRFLAAPGRAGHCNSLQETLEFAEDAKIRWVGCALASGADIKLYDMLTQGDKTLLLTRQDPALETLLICVAYHSGASPSDVLTMSTVAIRSIYVRYLKGLHKLSTPRCGEPGA